MSDRRTDRQTDTLWRHSPRLHSIARYNNQCCDHETNVSSTRNSRIRELVLLRSRSRELSGMVSFTAGCSRFYVNVVSTKYTSIFVSTRKAGYMAQPYFVLIILAVCSSSCIRGSMDTDNSLDNLLGLYKTRRIIGFQFCVFLSVLLYANTVLIAKFSESILVFLDRMWHQWKCLADSSRCTSTFKYENTQLVT